MAYFLGIDVGAARTVAAVARPELADVETVDLGERDEAGERLEGIASVLHLGADGVLAAGAAAQERVPSEPDRVVAGFPARIGDDAMLLAGEPWAPEELTAWLVRWVVDRVTEREGGPAAAVAVSHTGSGDPGRTQLLADAVAEHELDVAFVASPAGAGQTDHSSDGGEDGAACAARQAAQALRAAAAVTSAPRPASAADQEAATSEPGSARDEAAEGGDDAAAGSGWDVPAPRSAESGAHPADPATANLVAELVGFTGGMGATNTAGLLSGYTPPHGTPALWSSGHAAGAAAGTTMAASDVDLPVQRSGSGRWAAVASAVAEAPDLAAAPATGVPVRATPTVLVGVGGLGAAAAVVAALFLWPAPRTTDSAVRPVAAVPATTAAQPSAPAVPLTPVAEPVATHRSRPPAPRPRRAVVPPITASASATDTTPPPSDSAAPTEPPSSAPPSTAPTEPTEPTTTKSHEN